MASATDIPERTVPETEQEQNELEPLLGRPGDATQVTGSMMIKNLGIGTGVIAQLGAILLLATIWASVFLKDLIFFSAHPLVQSLAVFTLVQSILVLQPTHTAEQKQVGRKVHASLNLLAFLLLVSGVSVIEVNKYKYKLDHFHSVHAYLGVLTAVVILVQYFVGFTMWLTPALYGGEERAKGIWKYHRWSGYTVLTLLLATICSATRTTYNESVLKIKLWATLALSVVILIGVIPRIQKQKLGIGI